MQNYNPILITGCARSGTSMTAGVVHLSGAFGGTMSGATRYNQKGMFENSEIRNTIVKPTLKMMGYDPMGQKPLPDVRIFYGIDDLRILKIRKDFMRILIHEGLRDDNTFFYKGAKLCLMWPLWNKVFPTAKWIIVRRDDYDIAYSCMRTGFMSAYNTVNGWLGWVNEHKKRFLEMKTTNGMQVKEVWPQRAINGDYSELEKVIEWLGLEWKEEEVKKFISPELWHLEKQHVNTSN